MPFDAGPFELGAVVIRASVQSDPQTEQMTILGDPLPTILDGIPLRLKELALQLDRGEFQLNPDGCEPLTVTGTITSTQGSSVAIPTDPLGASSTQCVPPQATPSAPTSTAGGGSPRTAAVSLLGTRIFVRSNGGGDGDATVELRCTGTSTCHGKLTLTIGVRGSKRSGKRRGGHAKQVTTLATATYSTPPARPRRSSSS